MIYIAFRWHDYDGDDDDDDDDDDEDDDEDDDDDEDYEDDDNSQHLYSATNLLIPYVPKKITFGLSVSITSKFLNESKYDFRL